MFGMYGTVKAHKPEKDYPMRIVVSTIGTPTYEISKMLVDIIQPTLNRNKTCIKNSRMFVRDSNEWIISPNEIQVSYDVVNLYPSVPTKEATDIIIDFLSNDPSLSERTKLTLQEIRDLMDLCLNDCYFLWQNDVHKLDNSGPIGLALMVVVAEAFLQHHEEKALKVAKYQKINVKSFRRYVDDSHCRIPSIQQAEILRYLKHPIKAFEIHHGNGK